jgi:DNA-binding CsgD family transcriptional regulator
VQADAFWDEASRLEARGYTVAAAVMGVIAVEAVPDADRAEHVRRLLDGAQGAGPRDLAALAAAAVSVSPEPALALYRDSLRRGVPLLAARALGHAVRLLRTAGDDRGADRLRAEGDRLPEALRGLVGDDPESRLSARERQVVELVEAGLSNQQVAHRLGIAVSTVENHLHRAYRKLGVAGRDALVARSGRR